MTPTEERRFRTLMLPERAAWLQLLRGESEIDPEALPPDAVIHRIWFDQEKEALMFVVASAQYNIVHVGAVPPMDWPILRRKRQELGTILRRAVREVRETTGSGVSTDRGGR